MANANGKTAKQLIEAIKEAQGYVTKASAVLGVSRKTFYNYLNKYVSAQEALEDARAARHEWVESKLMKLINDDNVAGIIFYLKTQGKHLGYVERQEIDHGGRINWVVDWDDDDAE